MFKKNVNNLKAFHFNYQSSTVHEAGCDAGMSQWPQNFWTCLVLFRRHREKDFFTMLDVRLLISDQKECVWSETLGAPWQSVYSPTPLRARWGSLITESPALLSVLAPHAPAATPAPFRTASTSARENSSHSCSSVIRGLAAARGQRSHTAEFMFTLACRIFGITLEGGGEKKATLDWKCVPRVKVGRQYWDPRHQESEGCGSVKTDQ